jgi:small redox-active disulfide protein 2
MKEIKVLGTGCANCRTTIKLIEDVARERAVDVRLEKVECIEDIVATGVLRTPGVVIDGEVVHAGGIPTRDEVAAWLAAA